MNRARCALQKLDLTSNRTKLHIANKIKTAMVTDRCRVFVAVTDGLIPMNSVTQVVEMTVRIVIACNTCAICMRVICLLCVQQHAASVR